MSNKLKIPRDKDPRREKLVRSRRQETDCATRLGGVPVKGSGCGQEKGDVRVEGVVRIECKSTLNRSFSLKREVVEKIEKHALSAGEIPAIEIEFAGDRPLKVVVIPAHALKTLTDLK